MPKYNDFDLDIQNTTVSNAIPVGAAAATGGVPCMVINVSINYCSPYMTPYCPKPTVGCTESCRK